MPDDFFTPPVSPIQADAQRAIQSQQSQQLMKYAITQANSATDIADYGELDVFNPMAMAKRFESLESKLRKKGEESEKAGKEERKVAEVKRVEGVSERFQKQNYELSARTLLLLRARIGNEDTAEEILKKVLEVYSDHSLADEALDFLTETTEGELRERVQAAKRDLNALYGREVRAGKNMGAQAREFSNQGLGSPSALRDLYRDITGNPREPPILFEELAQQFHYDKMKKAIDFILHSLGSDLKSKGPSIARAELHRLMTEARTLQAILGVYRFFKSRIPMINSSFVRYGLDLPARVTFELLARLFVRFLQERYPTLDRVMMLAQQLGVTDVELGQIILYTQMRDAVRQVAPKLFKSEQHRQDVLMAFIDALEKLEEEMEEEGEEKEKEEEETEET